MPTPAEGSAGRRLALVIATGTYTDPALAQLRAPGQDASDLAAVLEDEAIGGFEVETVLDAPAESLRRRIARFCAGVSHGDLALIYLSCHGVLDDRGRLYYAAADTDRELLAATAVPSAWLNEQLEDCRGRRQVLVLDCCHSGAFAKGAKGESDLALRQRFEGRGRVVLTGSRGTEYSFEHDQVVGESSSSIFTGALVEGLRSGDADRDRDGVVTVSELYDYAYDAVRSREGRQTPTLWTYGAEGDLTVARSPRGAIIEPLPLPGDLVMALESARPGVREGAVKELAELLEGSNPGRALSARQELERVADEDVTSVANAARSVLGTAVPKVAPQAPSPPIPTASPPPPAKAPPSKPPTSSPPSPPPPPSPPSWLRGRGRRRTLALAGAGLVAGVAIVVGAAGGGGGESVSPGKIPLTGSPRGIAVGAKAAWVGRYDDGTVAKIERATGKVQQSVAAGPNPGKITDGEGSLWVSVEDGRMLARIDSDAAKPDHSQSFAGSDCECVSEMAIADGRMWVATTGEGAANGRLESFEPESGAPLGDVDPGPGFAGDFAVHEENLWAIGNDGSTSWVRWIDAAAPATTEDRRSAPGNSNWTFSGITYSGHQLWIADADDGLVIPFDPETEEFGQAIEVEKGISGDDIASVSSGILAWDAESGWMSRIDPEKGEVMEQEKIHGYETGSGEDSDLGTDETHAWVTDPAGEAVYRVKVVPEFSGF
ncbi:MAG: caspase, EACC1-associated type [Solirubrobacterales bacterium]